MLLQKQNNGQTAQALPKFTQQVLIIKRTFFDSIPLRQHHHENLD